MANQAMIAANEMPRGKLIGVRLSAEEVDLLDRFAAHLQAKSPPGVEINAQTALKSALQIAATQEGVLTPSVGARPRVKKTRR